jgi:hypothetical protein
MAANRSTTTNSVCPTCGRTGNAAAPDQPMDARIAKLEAENLRLREAAKRFGELAERLNEQLREERRRGQERRPRDVRDRRGFGAPTD